MCSSCVDVGLSEPLQLLVCKNVDSFSFVQPKTQKNGRRKGGDAEDVT